MFTHSPKPTGLFTNDTDAIGCYFILPWWWGRICRESFTVSLLILLRSVEITNHMRKVKDNYSELAIAIITCVVVDSNSGPGVGMV